jgi:hypothetical protein
MATSLEDILMAKAMADQEQQPDPAVAMGTGAAIGGTLSVLSDIPLTRRGPQQGPNGAPVGQQMPQDPAMRGRWKGKLGSVMAGGLVNSILGGALGLGARQAFVQESPAANMLAKLQSSGELDTMDRLQLQQVLKDIYNNPGVM